jgi:hypothetical protein
MRHAPTVARALINQAGELALVESGLSNLYYCATPVVPELGVEGMRKKPLLKSPTVPSRSTRTLVRDNRCSSRPSSPPSLVFLPPSGVGKKRRREPHTASGWRYCLCAIVFLMSPVLRRLFQHLFNRFVSVLTLPRWFLFLGGRLYEQCTVALTLGTLPKIAYRY